MGKATSTMFKIIYLIWKINSEVKTNLNEKTGDAEVLVYCCFEVNMKLILG